jgi:hypothetical protein
MKNPDMRQKHGRQKNRSYILIFGHTPCLVVPEITVVWWSSAEIGGDAGTISVWMGLDDSGWMRKGRDESGGMVGGAGEPYPWKTFSPPEGPGLQLQLHAKTE